MPVESPPRQATDGILAERRSSPGLLLALLGQDAMRRLRAAHDAHDLSPRQFQLLGLLAEQGPLSQRELGVAMGIAPSMLVTLLNPLEDAGDIARARDRSDRRCHRVTLLPAGARHLARAGQAQRDADDELFSVLTRGERDQLRHLLVTLHAATGHPPTPCEER